MAIFHMSAQTITRSKGHSSVAAAAYRHGEKLTDEHTGEIHDYSKKKGISDSVILIPERADQRFLKPEYLWNTIEKNEKRKDAQLAREFNIALPVEMTDEQKKALAIDFCNENFVKNGMIADIAFHKLDSDNPHFHVMLTTRSLTQDGSGFGQKVREWNSKEQLEGWRKSWADTANEHMQRAGIDARIDHRSLKDQKAELDALPSPTLEQQAQAISLDRPPTIHRGHSGNPERQERFDALQEVKVSQETKAHNHIEQNTLKPSPAAPASSPAASLMDAKQGGKKAASTGSAAATVSGSNINLADETTDKNLHLTEAQREELEDAENKEAAAKKKAYLTGGAGVPEISETNKIQSNTDFKNKLRKVKTAINKEDEEEENNHKINRPRLK
ncbi:MobA/MobL family protein [Escherichia coli]|uniref:MobQ family relaxase n=1 Tax=Escherichia coli TaxID=562 RepID=UPI00178805F9|nr:MobQ family relaxase [Escherichia coli]EEM9463147.1 molybdopterin-guanine dinucleotide biosynthesis protein MobA [Salmonella enterica]EGF4884805.1 MobA/MobL family protein [Salmonella enterica subsp. enterica serovar Indiana]HBS6539925.1 MobA/MobL family protein [Klebsiella pneumoniae]HDO8426539.1 MobA/MobL family protein [Salmonella enterica subsp. enterica serovar Concord]EFB1150688.1 MobA/MobL family protein [Escherichia coli]